MRNSINQGGSPSVPPALHGGLFDVLSKAREILSKHDNPQIERDETLLKTRVALKEATGIDDDAVLALVERHIHDFPEEPSEGFDDVTEYGRYVSSLNQILSLEHAMYKSAPKELRLRDPENPEKYRAQILAECADGRNMFTLFMPKNKLLGRFDTEWLPTAGNIIFPDVEIPKTPEEIAKLLNDNQELRNNVFERLDLLYGPKISESLQEYTQGDLSKVYVEFQSHFDSDHPTHGCGAHDSNLLAAQLEGIKDCLVTEEWIKDRYPEEYEAGLFRVFRTTHDTGIGKPVYSASKIDGTLEQADREKYAALFEHAARYFESPVAADYEEGIIRNYKGNPTGIETEEHDEQIIRLSNLHLASTLAGQSVLEVSWTNDPKTLYAHTKVLVGIIEKNYRKHHPDKPTIIHFDLVKGNEKIRAVYDQLDEMLMRDPDLKKRLEEGSLKVWTTETNRETYETETLPLAA